MRQPVKQNRIARAVRSLLGCNRGDSLLTSAFLTGAGLLGVSMMLPPLQDSAKTAGNALRDQAGVLARGSDTGSTNGFGSGGGGGGGSGMDFGAFTSAASQVGSMFGKAVETFGKAADQFGDAQNQGQDGQGQKKP